MYKHLVKFLIVLMSCGLMAGCDSDSNDNPDQGSLNVGEVQQVDDIVGVASSDSRFETLVTALQAAELVDTLKSDGPFTVFAPTDEAFAKLPEGVLDALLADKAALTTVLLYHVVAGEVPAATAVTMSDAKTVEGREIDLAVVDGDLMLNDAKVIVADINASNGVIHAIDTVLLPPKDIYNLAIANGFSTLVAAIEAAGLKPTLKGDGPFTVFAPTDQAFAALPAGTLDGLLQDIPALSNILLYHVLSGAVPAETAISLNGQQVATVQGGDIHISLRGSDLFVNDSQVIQADVTASNGIIHVINQVLLPQ